MLNFEKEREAFEQFVNDTYKDLIDKRICINSDGDYMAWDMQVAWRTWQAATARAEENLEGCVVVPKDQIEVWWQDAEEPENFATKEDDLSFIAQHIEDDEIMEIREHHTIHLPSIAKFGTWIYQSGQRKFFVGTKDEVEAARGGNE